MDEPQDRRDPIEVVAAAMAALGEATAAKIAEQAGYAYSTVTPRLRALEKDGRAERVHREGRSFWRLRDPRTRTHCGRCHPAACNRRGAGHRRGRCRRSPDLPGDPPRATNPDPVTDPPGPDTDEPGTDTGTGGEPGPATGKARRRPGRYATPRWASCGRIPTPRTRSVRCRS